MEGSEVDNGNTTNTRRHRRRGGMVQANDERDKKLAAAATAAELHAATGEVEHHQPPATIVQVAVAATIPTSVDDPLLSTGEAANMLGISVATVRKWLVAGLLIGGWMGGRFKVRKSCVDQQLRAMANSIKVG